MSKLWSWSGLIGWVDRQGRAEKLSEFCVTATSIAAAEKAALRVWGRKIPAGAQPLFLFDDPQPVGQVAQPITKGRLALAS